MCDQRPWNRLTCAGHTGGHGRAAVRVWREDALGMVCSVAQVAEPDGSAGRLADALGSMADCLELRSLGSPRLLASTR